MLLRGFAAVAAVVGVLSVVGCDKPEAKKESAGGEAAKTAAPGEKAFLKLSQFDKAAYCSLASAPDGTLHALFTDQPNPSKPKYVYHRASRDGGATWGEAKNVSDDETGHPASYCRVIADAKGRVYAVWKYVGPYELLDGPGGASSGVIAFRCLDGGNWSKIVPVTDDKIPACSWFVAPAPDGAVHLVWSQMSPDAQAAMSWGAAKYADLVQQAVLDGAALGPVKGLIVPEPVPTPAQVKAASEAGHSLTYAQQSPKPDGLINLRGYIDSTGTPHFIAEDPGAHDAANDQKSGKRIVLWDGKSLHPLYEYERYQTYNNFNDPPTLLVDAQGKQHVIRAPEKAETASVRDYPLDGDKLSDPAEVIKAPAGKGSILHWQAVQLPAGRMVAIAAVGDGPAIVAHIVELYISFSEGGGKWSDPQKITNNAAAESFMHKETTPGSAVATSKTYSPRFADVCIGKDGRPCLLMVNSEDTLLGLTSPGVTNSGRVVSVTGTGRVDAPMVFFTKL